MVSFLGDEGVDIGLEETLCCWRECLDTEAGKSLSCTQERIVETTSSRVTNNVNFGVFPDYAPVAKKSATLVSRSAFHLNTGRTSTAFPLTPML